MAFGGAVVLPAVLQWLGTIAWDALVGLFGGQALSLLLGIPFWLAVLIVLGVQAEMPWTIELAGLLDLFVLVFLMGIAINQLKTHFPEGEGAE